MKMEKRRAPVPYEFVFTLTDKEAQLLATCLGVAQEAPNPFPLSVLTIEEKKFAGQFRRDFVNLRRKQECE